MPSVQRFRSPSIHLRFLTCAANMSLYPLLYCFQYIQINCIKSLAILPRLRKRDNAPCIPEKSFTHMPLWQYSPVMPGTTLPLLADYLARFGSFEHDPLSPELGAWNTRDFDGLWKRARALDASAAVPYWGIVWPGGRGMARFILDNKKLFRKKRLLDVGTGSGITAAAAALAGAKVTGIDIDPAAIELAAMTTAANHVKCELLVAGVDDLSDSELSSYDIVMAGDIFNNREFADGMLSLVRRGFRRGIRNYLSDSGRSHRPVRGMEVRCAMRVPVFREIEGVTERDVKIFSMTE